MQSRGLIIAVALAIGGVGALWWFQNRSLTSDERLLFAKLDAAITRQPPEAQDIIAAFDLPPACGGKSCFFGSGNIGGLRFDSGDLRPSGNGLILVLEGFSDSCIRANRIETYYGAGDPELSCFDATCWYAEAQHSWGIIAFELEEPASRCISSAVINSLPEHRIVS